MTCLPDAGVVQVQSTFSDNCDRYTVFYARVLMAAITVNKTFCIFTFKNTFAHPTLSKAACMQRLWEARKHWQVCCVALVVNLQWIF